MQLTVQNDPGVACFGVRYNMESFCLLSQSDLQYYNGNVESYVLSGENYQILTVGGSKGECDLIHKESFVPN